MCCYKFHLNRKEEEKSQKSSLLKIVRLIVCNWGTIILYSQLTLRWITGFELKKILILCLSEKWQKNVADGQKCPNLGFSPFFNYAEAYLESESIF